jgi:hypothetical protein
MFCKCRRTTLGATQQQLQEEPIMQSPSHHTLKALDPKIWLVRGGAVAATVALLALSAPLIWAAVSAGAGLLSLAAMAAAGFASFQLMPLGLQKLENRVLALRKNEARANPIEQLQNDCLRREERLQSFRRALVSIGGKIESMRQMLEERRHSDSGHVLDRQQRGLDRMVHFYQGNLRRLDEAHQALDAFRHQVKQKGFEWEFAQAGRDVMAALNPSEVEDLMQDLLTDEALRSVQDHFNSVFAELDVEMRSFDAPTREILAEAHLDPLGQLELPQMKHHRSAV